MTQISGQGYSDGEVANALAEEAEKLASVDQNLADAKKGHKAAKNQLQQAQSAVKEIEAESAAAD